MSVKVKFKIGEKKGITANYTVKKDNPIKTVFKINEASASFYSLTGSPYDNANLKDALDAKADKSELDADMAAVDESISNVQTVVENNYNTLDTKIDNVNSDLSGDISTLENTVNSNNTAVNNRIDATNQTVADNNTAINNRVDGIVNSFDGDISNLETAIENEATARANNDTLLQGDINTLRNDLTSEISNRTSADNALQSQIDALVVSSDVFDVVGTYAELQAYDIATVPVNDIIKVLVDSTHNNAATYYRCVENNNVKSWSYIGAEGAYYTKSESDNRFVAKTITVNGQPLSSNIILTASDVGALPNTTTIPTKTSDLVNNSGFITNTVNNLTNYYLKSETYTKLEVQQLIASIPKFTVLVVQELPLTGQPMTLYLVPKEGASPDVYNEYIWIEADEDYELIGNTAIDLTNYVQFTDLATVATTGDYDDLIDKPIPPVGYGTSSTAAATATKVVSIPEITELNVGQVIIVKPSATSTVANSKIKLNDFEAYNMRYNNANTTTSTDSIVWTANVASMFIFDGTYWQFLGHGLDNDTNTTYSSMSVNEGITGTATSTRSLTATNLKQIIQDTKLKGLVTTNDADVVASDSITIGIGKLQAQSTKLEEIKQNTLNAGTDLEIIRYPVGETTIDGTDSITLDGAKANSLNSVTLYGACSQSSAPTSTNPVDITCNNGVIGWDSTNNVITVTGTTETVTDSLNNTATAEMLLAVGDFKDEQELLSGNVTRKFKVLVLNGTETWKSSVGEFYNTLSDIEQSITGTNTCLCTHFVQAENGTTEMNTFRVRLKHNGFSFKWDSSKTVAQWQAWLAEQYSNGTPVIVIYPLKTATTETVTAQTLNTQSGNNTLTITQASLTGLAISADYEGAGDIINFIGTIPTVNNGTVTINQGGTQKGTFTLNQSGNATINLDAGGGTPTNMVTTDTVQDISGRKTFLGEKAIYFKQVTTSNKLGFTLYNPNNTELAALEYRPNTISGASLLALNCPQTTGGYVGFRYWGTPAVNIVAPKVATAGNYFMATHITNGTLTVTADNKGVVNISTLIPTIATSVNSSSTNSQTVGAKLFYDTVGNIETLLSNV